MSSGARLTWTTIACERTTPSTPCSAATVRATPHIRERRRLPVTPLPVRFKDGLPVMGICLGHQLMGLASGLQTYKMRYGHRGANQPVVDLQDRTVSITSQNHGFAVAHPDDGMLAAHPTGATSPPVSNQHGSEVEVRYINANDGTVEGLDVIGKPCFTVQFHPEACPGPHDAAPLFLRFRAMVDAHLGGEN